MFRDPRPLAIDAHPRGPRGGIAAEPLDGRAVLDHHLDAAEALRPDPARPIVVHAPIQDHDRLRAILDRRGNGPIALRTTPAPSAPSALVLRVDRLYDTGRLRRLARRGGDAERAVLWRLDTPAGLAGASDELVRRRTYQPIGHYWALAPARALARRLAPTRVRPNQVTLLAFSLFVGAAALVGLAPRGWGWRFAAAGGLAAALVLDTADGHLARLQGTASAFGRWLDGWLDEVAEMVLHAAIAWSAYVQTGAAGWLAVGMVYGMGKFVLTCAQTPIEPSGASDLAASTAPAEGRLAAWVRLVGHADVRWHLWIVLAALGRLELALAAYAIYFPARALLAAVRKGVAHA